MIWFSKSTYVKWYSLERLFLQPTSESKAMLLSIFELLEFQHQYLPCFPYYSLLSIHANRESTWQNVDSTFSIS